MSRMIRQQALDWMVLLCSGRADARDQARFAAWQAADPAHEQAWRELRDSVGTPLAALRRAGAADAARPGTALRDMLANGPSRRRFLGKTLALGALGVGLGWGGIRQWRQRADLSTGVAERQVFRMDDGSELLLNARTAVQFDLQAGQRRVRLLHGALIASVAPDAARPFRVETRDGVAQTSEARFLVRQDEDDTLVSVMEHTVRVRSHGGQQADLLAGQGARYSRTRVVLADAQQAALRASWEHGRIEVLDEPLGYVIAELRAYTPGLVHVSDAAAALRVQGVFPLDRPDQALDALAATLPLRVARYGRWLTVIDLG